MRRTIATILMFSAAPALTAGAADFSFSRPVESPLPKGQTPIVIRMSDLDGDGKPDAIVTGRNWDGERGTGARVAIMKGVGDGTFTPWHEVTVSEGNAEDARLVDMDGDRVLDLVVSVSSAQSRVAIFHGNGDGTFAAPSYTAVERSPRGLCTADIDGDGDLDVVCSNYNSASLSILRNDGAGFTNLATVRLMRYLGGLAFPQQVNDADVNGDGRADILTTTIGGGRLTTLRGIADGPFAPAADWKPDLINGEVPAVIGSSIADFDNDGDVDVALPVLLVTQAQKIVTLRNDGAGAFAEQKVHDIFGFYYTWCSTPLDVDGDGRLDIAIGTALTGAVFFQRNETAGPAAPISFVGQPIFVSYGFFVRDLTSADVDGDGDADLVGVEIAGSTIFTLLNTTGQGIASAEGAAPPRPQKPPTASGKPQAMPVSRDLTDDGAIDARDVAVWLEAWLPPRPPATNPPGGRR